METGICLTSLTCLSPSRSSHLLTEATGPAVAELQRHTAPEAYSRTAHACLVRRNGRRDMVRRLLQPGPGALRTPRGDESNDHHNYYEKLTCIVIILYIYVCIIYIYQLFCLIELI